MKKAGVFILLTVLLVSIVTASALTSGNDALQGFSDEELLNELYRRIAEGSSVSQSSDSVITAKAIDKLSTRSGPSTGYSDTETYNVIGDSIRIISRFDDHGGVCWLQCDIPVGSTYRRLYTGLKRFDTTGFDISNVPLEAPLNYPARVTAASNAMYGPGGNYGTYGGLTLNKGKVVTIIAIEDGYAQVEWKTDKQIYRAWVSVSALKY